VRNEVGKGNKIFDQATQIVVDMSTALGQDLKSSSIQVGKALNDPIKGVTALQRVGVSFTKQQKDQIKTLVDSGKTLDAQKLILRELGKEFGGAAEAAATPMDKLRVKVGNLEETIGTKLIPIEDKAATFLLDKGIPAIEKFVKGFQDGDGAGGQFADAVGQVGDGLETAWHVGKPFLSFIADHPKLFADVAIGAGAFAAAFKIIGSVKKLPGLGTLASKATPLPVFVTNPGFGIGPKGPKVPPVVSPPGGKKPPIPLPRGIPAVKGVAGGAGAVLAAGMIGNAIGTHVAKSLAVSSDRNLSDLQKSARSALEKALNTYASRTGKTPTADMLAELKNAITDQRIGVGAKSTNSVDLVAALDFLKKYGGQTAEVRAEINKLAKDPTVARALKQRAQDAANNTRLISGDLLGLMTDANKKTRQIGDDVAKGLGGGLGRAQERADALRDSLDKTQAPKINPDALVGLYGGLGRAKERTDDLRTSVTKLPGAFRPPVDAAHTFLTELGKIPSHKDIIFTASIKTSGKSIKIAGLHTDSAGVYVQGFGGKKLLADGGWVLGPGTSRSDSIPAMLSNREFVVNAKAAQKYAPQLEAMNAGRDAPVSSKAGFAHYGDLNVYNTSGRPITAAEALQAQRDRAFLAGY
jgi:hypothetical protein